MNADDGVMRVTSTTADLGNDVVAFGTTLPDKSLGFNVIGLSAQPVLPPVLSISKEGATASVSFTSPNNGLSYILRRSTGDFAVWNPVATYTGNGTMHVFSETVNGKGFFKLEYPSE